MSMNNNSSEIVTDLKLQKFVTTKLHEMLINELQHYDVTTITMHIFLKNIYIESESEPDHSPSTKGVVWLRETSLSSQ